MRTFAVLICGVVLPALLLAQPSLDTLRHLDVQPLGSYSAIWGYTAPDGREYALLGVNGSTSVPYPGGTSIIDITDHDNIRQVAFIPGPNSSWREMKTYRHYAYVVTEAGGGVQIIDLSQLPDTAWLVRPFNYANGSKNILRSHSVSLHDGFLYLNGCANWSPGGMVIFDLRNDPENPQFAGEYQPAYIHDSYVLRDTIYGSAINSGGGLYIADARNKSAITPIGKISYAGSGTHNAWVTSDRGYVVTTDEIGSTPKTLKVWDIGNLPNIPDTAVATFTSTPGQIEHNITIRGDYAYVAWYSAGLVIVDLSNPAIPVLADAYDTSPSTSGYSGVWGVYPFFPSGKIIAGDMQNGLWVFRFDGLAPRQPVALLEPHNQDTTGGQVTFRWSGAANPGDDPHRYEVHILGGDADETVTVTDTVLQIPDLLPGAYTWYVVTKDEWNSTASADTFSFIVGTINSIMPAERPYGFRLAQNYPNPFNPVTSIQYEIAEQGPVSLRIFNVLGEEVVGLVSGIQAPGVYSVSVDAGNLASGLYFYRLQAGGFAETRKMVVMR